MEFDAGKNHNMGMKKTLLTKKPMLYILRKVIKLWIKMIVRKAYTHKACVCSHVN